MESPIFCMKHSKWEIVTFEAVHLVLIVFPLIMAMKGAIEKDIFLIAYGLVVMITFLLIFRYYRSDVRGHVAVYPNRIVEKKKRITEVLFNEVIEVKYFKKEIRSRQTWFFDCLQFYFKDQTTPVFITLTSKGTVTPYTMREETQEVLTYIRVNYPLVKYTKENWSGPY